MVVFVVWTRASFAQCPTIELKKHLSLAEQQLLEGAIQNAQGTLFQIKEQIHCQRFSHKEVQHYLFYSGVYYHLREEPQIAQQFFKNTIANDHPNFGEEMMEYADVFQSSFKTWPFPIRKSRFHTLSVDGKEWERFSKLQQGVHLIQVYKSNSKIPIYAQWFSVDDEPPSTISVPRNSPKWPLYMAGTQGVIAGFSFWMYTRKQMEAEESPTQELYRKTKEESTKWLFAGGGFSALSLAMLGVYYIW